MQAAPLKSLPFCSEAPADLELWISLGSGKAVRARLALVEEGMPSPGESDLVRQPFLGEVLEAVKQSRNHRNVSLIKPF